MKANILYPSQRGYDKYDGFKPIPAIRSMKINLGLENEFLTNTDLRRRLPPEIECKSIQTKSMNRYIWWQKERAKRSNPTLFWTIAKFCIKKSISFRVSAYNSVNFGWWHSTSIYQVKKDLKRISRIIREEKDDLIYNRVYIPKKDTHRPLGVPRLDWRVVMHMHAKWLTLFLAKEVSWFNHAYQPGKGTKSAIKDLVEKVLPAKYIYEFDLKQFFPSVDVEEVTSKLISLGVPKSYSYWLENVNRCSPKLPSTHLLNEDRTTKRIQMQNDLKKGYADFSSPLFDCVREMDKEELRTMVLEDGCDNLFEWVQMQWVKFDEYGLGGFNDNFKELPQGLNTSPILSLITLIDWAKKLKAKGVNLLMYADDGIMYSDQPFEPESPKSTPIHPEKSRWLKKGEKLRASIKFLGIKYNKTTKLIEGSTRKGSTLKWNSKNMKIFDLLKFLRNWDYDRMENLTKSNLLGQVLSKLYTGSWTDPKIELKEWKNHPESWWAGPEFKGERIQSSNACVWLANEVRWSIHKLKSNRSVFYERNLRKKLFGLQRPYLDKESRVKKNLWTNKFK